MTERIGDARLIVVLIVSITRRLSCTIRYADQPLTLIVARYRFRNDAVRAGVVDGQITCHRRIVISCHALLGSPLGSDHHDVAIDAVVTILHDVAVGVRR